MGFAGSHARGDCAAHILETLGIRGGDRVLWLEQNSRRVLEQLSAPLGVANRRQSVSELSFAINDIQAKAVFRQKQELSAMTTEGRAGSGHFRQDYQALDMRFDGGNYPAYKRTA